MESETIEIGQRLENGAIVISVTKKGNRAKIIDLLPISVTLITIAPFSNFCPISIVSDSILYPCLL